MSILYFSSIILLFITILLIKKVDRKVSLISSFVITTIAFICYQAIVAYFLDLVKIPITLLTMSIINGIVIVALWLIYYVKIKQFQSYTIKKENIILVLILLLINGPILYKEYGLLENFRYTSTDAVMHCQAAMTFSKGDFLLDSMTNWEAINPTFMIASYVNDGLLMKALVNWIGEFNLYKVYLFTDISYYLMIGYVFYLLITSSAKCDTRLKKIIAYGITLLFLIGYPLNSVITGFHYFTLGILEFISILYVINAFYKENKKITYILLFLLNTGIMLTYNLLAPILYIAEFLYLIYEKKERKEKLVTKKNLFELLILFIIPGTIGLSFFFLPRIVENIVLENQQQLWIDGYIYINYWSNLIVMLPFVFYYLIRKAKENKLNLGMMVLFVITIFMLGLFIGLKMGYVSTYYVMKPYFILHAIVWLLFYQSIEKIVEDGKLEKIVITSFLILYYVILLITLLFTKVGPYDFQTNQESIKNIFDIYNSNKAIMTYVQNNFVEDRMDALHYIHENQLIENQNLLYIGNYVDNFLFKMFFTYENREGIDKNNIKEHIEKWNQGDYEYLVMFLKDTYSKYYQNNLDLRKGKLMFETEHCAIYQYEK